MSTRCRSLYVDKDVSESSNYCDIDKVAKPIKSHKTSFHVLAPCKGRLLLEISVHNQSTLKIHIIRAEFPKTSLKEPEETFIKINFTSSNVEKQMSPLAKRISNTDFTFRYDGYCLFNKLNMNQRIIISAYVMDGTNVLILGSMSFGIKKIWESEMLTGWYYLLKENIGSKKHLKVYQETIPRSITADVLCTDTTDTTSELIKVDLRRKGNEFGFTICGNQPPYIGKVEKNSAADDCNLQSGDVIVKIEHLLVFSCSAKAIAQILRLYPDEVSLTVYRSKIPKASEELYIDSTNNPKSPKDVIKFHTKSKSLSWIKRLMTSKKKINKSSENFQQNYYVSNLGYKMNDCHIDDGLNKQISADIDGNKDNKVNVIDRLQYLGHIQSVKFPSNHNANVEYITNLWLIEATTRISVTILLFNQLFLITHVEPDGFYTVIKRPIIIDNIMYLSMPITSKYDLVLQYRADGGINETIHFHGETVEFFTNLLKEKRVTYRTEISTT